MNKQAITFLSLFSLILILSVYYMLLPENEVTVTTSLSAISQLQSDLDKRREQIEIKNQEIISQENSTSESIKLALEVIQENKEQSQIEEKNIEVFLPNCYDDPSKEEKMWDLGEVEHQNFKAKMYKQSEDTIKNMDAVLVLNFDKNTEGKIEKNYIGGATFLEMYDAFRLNKKIYLYNDINYE